MAIFFVGMLVRVNGYDGDWIVLSSSWGAGLGDHGVEITGFSIGNMNDAITRLVAETKARGGNAIICLRFESGDMGGFAQCCAYGTAAIVEKIDSNA
ncbi:hypothetical protein F4814DRAFT_443846 [Daldinia grandis]|nr:hypothetical protein F4814DRAFT_443846 [Daldinia grandis]